MHIHSHTLSPSAIFPISPFCKTLISHLCVTPKGFHLSQSRRLYASRSNGKSNWRFRWRNRRDVVFSALDEWSFGSLKLNSQRGVIFSAFNGWNAGVDSTGSEFTRKRKIVEHICLLKAKADLTDDEEKDMLDYLYTSQYQMGGIIAISLGRITDMKADGFTHAVYMRFQRKEDLAKFYDNVYSRLLKEHVIPYCHEWINVDYESEVEDDILPIFRKGEEFNYGVESVLLISVIGSAIGGPVEDALATFAKLTEDFGSLIVQATQGSNFNLSDRDYTHAVVIRFSSFEALEIFRNSSEYKDVCKLIP
ncbi:uncharacterized protein LOC131230729 isoform X2 [Magnolia sinica]|uniref:uncharacterized protein LOC131230729 isoform X2 n=1 Tax=Magnolia sinica TaxID=86752 RepID=UPI00265A330D|nr:uncharacterized protein LOC131230729 isoform X2 [Magnolia sinica]